MHPATLLLVRIHPRRGVAEQPPERVKIGLDDAMFPEGVALQRPASRRVVDGSLAVVDERDELLSTAVLPDQGLSHQVSVVGVAVHRQRVIEVSVEVGASRRRIVAVGGHPVSV